MKPAELEHFGRFGFPRGLRAGPGGALCFALRRANFKANRYDTTLWILREGGPGRLILPGGQGGLAGHWWHGERLLLARPGGRKERALAAAGLPFTLLQSMAPAAPGEALDVREEARLYLDVEDAAPLADGRVLLLARCSPAAEAALAAAGGDAAKAAEALREEAACEVLTELPFWENGGGYVARRRRRLYMLENGEARPLTDEHTEVTALRLSPSGGAAFFIAMDWRLRQPLTQRLWRLEAATLAMEDVSFAELRLDAVAPLDDDTAVVAGSDMLKYGLNQNPAFYRLDAAAKSAATLYGGGEYGGGATVNSDLSMPEEARWYAKGGHVYWLSTRGESAHLMRLCAESGAIEAVTRQSGAVSEIAPAGEGHYAIALRGQCGPEVYRVEEDGAETRLSRFNAGPEKTYTYAIPAPAASAGARGSKIRGFVLRPPALPEGEKCPAILDIHGGPKTVYGPVLFHEMQYWAARGFAVLCCNPCGSDGRGDAFADIRGRYGEEDCEDILAFLDAALARFDFIDPERLGVAGGSYGGFMTNWLIGHTRRFKAAASQRGISNWGGFWGTSDIGPFFTPDQTAASPWDGAERLWAQSPLKYAPQAGTPTLFIHSDEDYRCPAPEALQMYSALVAQGTDSRLVLFRGENHELSRSGRPKNRLRRLKEMTEWFERYLMSVGDEKA